MLTGILIKRSAECDLAKSVCFWMNECHSRLLARFLCCLCVSCPMTVNNMMTIVRTAKFTAPARQPITGPATAIKIIRVCNNCTEILFFKFCNQKAHCRLWKALQCCLELWCEHVCTREKEKRRERELVSERERERERAKLTSPRLWRLN